MPGFDNLQGLWLLLLIPLLILLDRLRSRARPVVLSVFPLLAAGEPEPVKPPPLIFRVRRKYRVYIASGVVLLASMAVCGAHLTVRASRPARLLVVLDNTMALAETVGGETLLAAALRSIEDVGGSLARGSSLAVLTTGPRPRLRVGGSPDEVQRSLSDVRPSSFVPPVSQLVPSVLALAKGDEGRRILVVSTRAETWRSELGLDRPPGVDVLPDAEVRRGNVGITAFDLRPSVAVPDSRDLYFRLASAGALPSPPRLLLETSDGRVRAIDAGDRTEMTLVGLALPDGPLTLSLDRTDAFSQDDRVRATVYSISRIRVRLLGGDPGPLLTALRTYEGFVLEEEGVTPDAVDVYFKAVPEAMERPSLVIGPPGAFFDLRYRRLVDKTVPGTFHPSHPVTRDVSFWNFIPSRVLELDPPEGFEVLARSGSVPLVLAGRVRGHRLLVWAFDPFTSGIHLDPSFLILLRGSLEWLSGQLPADWDRIGCEGLLEPGVSDANLLCQSVSEEAGLLTIPKLDALTDVLPKDTAPRRVDLAFLLLLSAALLALYLAIVNVYASENIL